MLRIVERIQIAIELGESHFREFKSAFEGPSDKKSRRPIKQICSDIGKTLVAFANADGGELLVGVEDEGIVSGLDFNDQQIRLLLEAPKSHVHKDTPLPSVRSLVVSYKDKNILYFSVPKGTSYVYLTSDGRCLQRKDLESVPISSEQIKFSREEAHSREYDREFVITADINDLDITLINHVCRELSIAISPEKFLQHLDLAEFDGSRLQLKRAALLLFAKTPHKWHPRLQVRIVKIAGTELKSGENFNVLKDEEVSDNLVNLLESSWELLRPHLTETRISKSGIFRTQIIYPELACREALINAIAHRDYNIEGRGIEVYVYDDRLEILSPGELLSSIKIEDLIEEKGVHQSRNSLISRVLREIGYMRELGEGIRRIFNLMRNNDLVPPQFRSEGKSFNVILHQKLVYSKEERIWLENFQHLDLTREQKTVVRLGTNGTLISPAEIWEAVGIVDTDKYRQLLESLSELGVLRREVSSSKAYSLAREKKVSKKAIKQFEIILPHQKETFTDDMIDQEDAILDDSDYAKIYITNIPYESDERELYTLFSNYGDVVSVVIPRNHETGHPRGFAFIEFDKRSSVVKVFSDKKNIYLRKRKIFVQAFDPNK